MKFLHHLLVTLSSLTVLCSCATSSIELFFSQQSINNPCSGLPLTFDFGYFNMKMSKTNDIMTGSLSLQQTIRHKGSSYSHKDVSTFSIVVPKDATEYNAVLRYNITNSPFALIYLIKYTLTKVNVVAATLQEIQAGKC